MQWVGGHAPTLPAAHGEVPAPGRFDTDPPAMRRIYMTNHLACGQISASPSRSGHAGIRRPAHGWATVLRQPFERQPFRKIRGPDMHPMVKPALRRGWRDLNTVQFGMTPAHALTLGPMDTATGSFLDLLNGTCGLDRLREEGLRMDLPDGHVDRLVARLSRAGLLDDSRGGGPAADALREKREVLDRLRPDLASLTLTTSAPGDALGRLAARRGARVQVRGAGRVGSMLAALLSGAGVGEVDVRDIGRVEPWDVAPGGLPRKPSATAGTRRPAVWCAGPHRTGRRVGPLRPLRRRAPPGSPW